MSAAYQCDKCKRYVDNTTEPKFEVIACCPASWNNTVGVEQGTMLPIDICPECFNEICKDWKVAQPKGGWKVRS